MKNYTNSNNTGQHLKDLIKQGELDVALEELGHLCPNDNYINNLIGQYYAAKKDKEQAQTYHAENGDATIAINRVRDAALQYIDEKNGQFSKKRINFWSPYCYIIGYIPAYMEKDALSYCYVRIAEETLKETIRKALTQKKQTIKADLEEKKVQIEDNNSPTTFTSKLVELTYSDTTHFDIIQIQNKQQPYHKGDIVEWDYRVKPLCEGNFPLVLRLESDKLSEKVFNKDVQVIPNGAYNEQHALGNVKEAPQVPRYYFPNNKFVIALLPLLIFLSANLFAVGVGGGIAAIILIGSLTKKDINVTFNRKLKLSDVTIKIDGITPDTVYKLTDSTIQVSHDFSDLISKDLDKGDMDHVLTVTTNGHKDTSYPFSTLGMENYNFKFVPITKPPIPPIQPKPNPPTNPQPPNPIGKTLNPDDTTLEKPIVIMLRSSLPFKEDPVVEIDNEAMDYITLVNNNKDIKIEYPEKKDNKPKIITVTEGKRVCKTTAIIDKDSNDYKLLCNGNVADAPKPKPEDVPTSKKPPVPKVSVYKVVFILDEDILKHKEAIEVQLDGHVKKYLKEYRFDGNALILPVYGNADRNGDKLNDPRDIRLQLLIPSKTPIGLCSFKGSLTKDITFKCNECVALK